MNRALTTWKWSLGVIARSYPTVIVVAVLIALWALAAYEWLGMPAESSSLLMILSLIWAVAQLLIATMIIGGTLAGAGETSANEDKRFPPRSIWTQSRRKIASTLLFCLASLAIVSICSAAFDWINAHSVEVASFLTFRSQKPVSYELIEKIDNGIELLLWTIVGGFLLSFYIAMRRMGWRGAGKQSAALFAACCYRTPFLTGLLSVLVFGGLIHELTRRHPIVPPGFWDYTQVVVRFSLALFILSAGSLFWSLSLARLLTLKQGSSRSEQSLPKSS